MDHESQSLKPAFVTDHCIRENCPKCVHLQRRYCVYLCAMCAVFAFINMVVPIYIVGQQNANAESDILNQLHVLQARIENLEAINNRGLSVATELHDDSVDLPAKEGNDFPLSEFLKERRVKRRVFKKGPKGKRRHKPKTAVLSVLHMSGRGGYHGNGTFHKWQYADWFFKSNADDKHFKLHFGNGTLEVMQPGLYLLYSQITLKGNGTQGYHVMRNDKDPILACYSNNMMLHEEDKTSCFTMGMFKLDKRDIISVKHISTSGVRAVFTSNASFFGLVRLGRFNKRGVVLAV
ncbi:uncharacterized protein LOC128179810 isoform X7 [Crassostrea angulata]|uniref:uncharacterized protein LOC128179810 isoform X7 n=1 Tax=Magallana angulata TaxID=2784310 RepID=UPI0022B10BE4|nr:uncharacterized protein LOC128179810 isoform X7 [Crassostrea angulata]